MSPIAGASFPRQCLSIEWTVSAYNGNCEQLVAPQSDVRWRGRQTRSRQHIKKAPILAGGGFSKEGVAINS